MLWIIYVQLLCFFLGLGFGVAFFVTGRKKRSLSLGAGVFLMMGSVLQLFSRGS